MNWEISIPHESRDQPLDRAIGLCPALPAGGDRETARTIMSVAAIEGAMRTAGDLLDRLEELSPVERKELIDLARQANGLPSVGQVDAEEAISQASAAAAARARERDLEPRWGFTDLGVWADLNQLPQSAPLTVRVSPAGVPLDPDHDLETERELVRARHRAAAQENERQERERQAAEIAEVERARDQHLVAAMPPGLRP